jgi:hypothetical protein
MKLTSRLTTSRKIVLSAVALLSFAGIATAASSSFQESDWFFNRSVLTPSQSVLGALTLDETYTFDYATAGIGTTIFRPSARRTFITPVQDMPRAVPGWNSSTVSSTSFYVPTYESYHLPGGFSLDLDSVGSEDNIPVPLPEPSTWMGGLLALAAIGFTQRRRLRRLTANRA